MSKKKSVVNIVKIPLISHLKERGLRINKNLLLPVNLTSNLSRSSEKLVDRRIGANSVQKSNSRSKSDVKKAPGKTHKISKFKSKLFKEHYTLTAPG